MSSARRTPAYVRVIGAAENSPQAQGPKLVGPERFIGPVEKRNTGRTEVIPLRREMPASLPPIPSSDILKRPAARRIVPVANRPWRVMIVPASPSAPTRSFDLARWQARVMAAAVAGALMVMIGVVTVVVLAVQQPDVFMPSGEATLLRARLAVMQDSLAEARAAVEEMEAVNAATDSAVAELESARAPVPIKPVAASSKPPLSRTAAVHAHSSESRSDAAPSAGTDSRLFDGLPVIGAIASGFSRARRHPLLHIIRPHLGLDIAAQRGTPIVAPAAGRVSFVGRKFGFGLVVEITHPHAVATRYGHLKSANVRVGEHVERGALIAAVGSSGLSTGPHLHYEVVVQGKRVDPLHYHFAVEDSQTPVANLAGASPLPLATPVPLGSPALTGAPGATGAHEETASAGQPVTPR